MLILYILEEEKTQIGVKRIGLVVSSNLWKDYIENEYINRMVAWGDCLQRRRDFFLGGLWLVLVEDSSRWRRRRVVCGGLDFLYHSGISLFYTVE